MLKKSKITMSNRKQSILSIIIIIVAAILFEVFICNFRYFESRGNQPFTDYEMHLGEGIVDCGNGLYYVNPDSENKQIELKNINQELMNVKIDITKENIANQPEQNKYEALTVQLWAMDKGNSGYFQLPHRTIAKCNDRTQYIKLNLSGESPAMMIDLSSASGYNIRIHEIAFNVTVPFDFSKARCLAFVFVGVFVWAFIYIRKWSDITFDIKSHKQKAIALAIIAVQIGIWTVIGSSNPYFATEWINRQYYDLVAALDAGQANLLLEVDPQLAAMENPYDSGLREATGVAFNWDYAFYEGQYYLYFGIVPALLVYLPYFKLTGTNIPNNQVVLIGMVFAAVGLMLLMRKLADRYFKKVSAVIFFILYVISVNAMGCAFMAHRPDFYSVPNIFGLAFTLWGLYAWLSASHTSGKMSLVKLFLGALCMALVAGCRPQLLLASFFFLPIIGSQWLTMLKEKKKELWLEVIVVAIPYLVVAAGLMYYNQIRFGSPFDFGANYNLTTNDMTSRGWKWDRIGVGIFAYLFMPSRIRCTFPFLDSAYVDSAYQGVTISEQMYGGAFAICPFLLVGLVAVFAKKFYDNKKLYIVHVMSILFALVIVVMDAQMAGILYRYMSDFMIFLLVPSCMAVMYLEPKLKGNVCYEPIVRVFLGVMAYSFVLYNLLYIVLDAYNFQEMNPEFYYRIASVVQFWL